MDVPLGTWMGSVKVDNDEIWNDYVKTGKVKGFSIEGAIATVWCNQPCHSAET